MCTAPATVGHEKFVFAFDSNDVKPFTELHQLPSSSAELVHLSREFFLAEAHRPLPTNLPTQPVTLNKKLFLAPATVPPMIA